MFYYEKVNVGSEYSKSRIHNVRVKDDGDFVDVNPGDLVVIDTIAEDDLYTAAFTRATGVATSYLNLNGFDGAYPTTPLTDKVLICDPAVVATATNGKKEYNIGNETYGNKLGKGRFGRVRDIQLHEVFKLGDENFDVAPTEGKYATAKANSPLHAAADTIPATGYCVKIVKKMIETTGAEAGFATYLVQVVQL